MEDIIRRKIDFGRHGEKLAKPRQNDLTDNSIQSIYHNSGRDLRDFVEENRITPDQAFVLHSNEKRTLRTAKAKAASAFRLIPEMTNLGLDQLMIPGMTIAEHLGLSYGTEIGKDFHLAMEAFKEDGTAKYMANWAANPDATTYSSTGEKITPFNQVIKNSGNCLVDALGFLLNPDNKQYLGILVSHGGPTEGLLYAGVNSGRRRTHAKGLADVGGHFDPEEGATLEVDQFFRSGNISKATLTRDDKSYPVNVQKLKELYGGRK